MHFDFYSLSWNCYCSISGTGRFLHYNMCLLRWEKWDAGTLNGSTVRMHLVTGFCCNNGYKVSFHQVATDTSEIIIHVDEILLFCLFPSAYLVHMCLDWHCLLGLQLIHLPTNLSHLGKLCGLLHDQLNTQCHPKSSTVHNHVPPV